MPGSNAFQLFFRSAARPPPTYERHHKDTSICIQIYKHMILLYETPSLSLSLSLSTLAEQKRGKPHELNYKLNADFAQWKLHQQIKTHLWVKRLCKSVAGGSRQARDVMHAGDEFLKGCKSGDETLQVHASTCKYNKTKFRSPRFTAKL